VLEPAVGGAEADREAWQRNAEAMLQAAIGHGPENVTLLALWDGRPTESPGGPTYLLARAHTLSLRTVHIDTRRIFSQDRGA
jgi:hypothetical protein